MLYLGNGIYLDCERLIALKFTSDNKRPSIISDLATEGETTINGVKISVV